MLLTEAFGGRGGIAKFNRDFLSALTAGGTRGVKVTALPRAIDEPAVAPRGLDYDREAAAGAGAFLRRVVRLMLMRRACDLVICGHINLLPPAWALARLNRARLVLIVHGYEAWQPPRRWLARWLAPRVDHVVAVSRLSAARFVAWSGGGGRACVLPNAVDLDRFTPASRDAALAARYGVGRGPVIMTLGRMDRHERASGVDKGFERLIGLMPRLSARVPGLTCVIAGDGDDRPRLEAMAAALGLGGRVVFTGEVDEADKAALYNLADAFVLPSKGEGFGIVLIEAAACGLAVVGSSRDGSREALLDGVLGRLVDPDDAEALENAIVAALGEPRHRRAAVEAFALTGFSSRVAAWLDQTAPRS